MKTRAAHRFKNEFRCRHCGVERRRDPVRRWGLWEYFVDGVWTRNCPPCHEGENPKQDNLPKPTSESSPENVWLLVWLDGEATMGQREGDEWWVFDRGNSEMIFTKSLGRVTHWDFMPKDFK